MKLIAKTTRYYLIFTFIIFSLGTVLFYFLIRNVLYDSIDEALHQEKVQLIDNLRYEKDIDQLTISQNIYIVKTPPAKPFDKYSTISVFDPRENVHVDFRELSSIFHHENQYYKINVRQSLSEAEVLIESLIPVVIFLFLILLAGIFLLNRSTSKKVWEPFYVLLEKLTTYDFSKKNIPFQYSGIQEFDALGENIEKMTTKIYQDYESQKEFNENSSHELQTPLAIIRNKLELLIQSKRLNEEDMVYIQSIFDAVNRLSHLNKGLILLSKIDNNQYRDLEMVDLRSLVNEALLGFQEQIAEKEIRLEAHLKKSMNIKSNLLLIQTLIYNLLSNAIKYNLQGGVLRVEITSYSLIIVNTGEDLKSDPQLMFRRFKKNQKTENSVGLGLSIVKKICDFFGYHLSYTNNSGWHKISVTFFQ